MEALFEGPVGKELLSGAVPIVLAGRILDPATCRKALRANPQANRAGWPGYREMSMTWALDFAATSCL